MQRKNEKYNSNDLIHDCFQVSVSTVQLFQIEMMPLEILFRISREEALASISFCPILKGILSKGSF